MAYILQSTDIVVHGFADKGDPFPPRVFGDMYQADVLPHTRRLTMTFAIYGGNRTQLTAIISGTLLHYRTLPGLAWPVGTCTQGNFCDKTSLSTGRATGLL